jgi:hypothetical protein
MNFLNLVKTHLRRKNLFAKGSSEVSIFHNHAFASNTWVPARFGPSQSCPPAAGRARLRRRVAGGGKQMAQIDD